MKKEIKGFILGVLTTLVLTSGITFAYSQYKTIDVVENNVTIYANDNIVTAPNFTYNNTTYVPLRSVLELMNCSIFYDEASKEVKAYNNFLKPNLPTIYNGNSYETIVEYGYDENNSYSITSFYTDLTLLWNTRTLTTDFNDDEFAIYVYDLYDFSQQEDNNYSSGNYYNSDSNYSAYQAELQSLTNNYNAKVELLKSTYESECARLTREGERAYDDALARTAARTGGNMSSMARTAANSAKQAFEDQKNILKTQLETDLLNAESEYLNSVNQLKLIYGITE